MYTSSRNKDIVRRRLLALFVVLFTFNPAAESTIFSIASFPLPILLLQVGSGGATVNQVSFSVPANQLGNGNPIQGSGDLFVGMVIRAAPPFSRVGTLTVDSSTPLNNGANTAPFSEIYWESRFEDIPSGNYDDTNNQFLVAFPNSFVIIDNHRFFYSNTQILESGSYNGRVTYTLTMP